MKLEFWGVRGTRPVTGRGGSRYGVATPSALIKPRSGDPVIIDAGTGIIGLGERLARAAGPSRRNIHILLTHFHLDHIMGLPFFAPVHDKNATLTFHSAAEPEEAEELVAGLMAGRRFPLSFSGTPSVKRFKKLPPGTLRIGSLAVSHHPLNHPQGATAFRVDEGAASVVFATDTEHPLKGLDEGLAGFARKADLLIYDATFTPRDYEAGKRGWGHSTWLEGTKLARAAAAKTLVLSHLNPEYSDKTIDGLVRSARRAFPRTRAAREGWSIEPRGA